MSSSAPDALELVLQVHLANDNSAVQHLPTVLASLNSPDYARSQHLRKFCTRLNALVHAKDPAPRWSGILIAEHAFRLNKDAVLDHAQSWVTVVLPILSRKESPALWKAAISLLDTVFVTTSGLAEFQRQVTNPNASKFGLALLALADKGDEELQIVVLTALARLVAVFPTLVRPLHAQASTLSLRFLQGRYPSPQSVPLVAAAAQLHSVLHLTGGKVGGAALWKKSIDEALLAANAHLSELRSTFEDGQRLDAGSTDPAITIPHALDALRGTVALLCHLLRSPSSRSLPVPIGSVVRTCARLLQATPEESLQHTYERSRRAMEAVAVPEVWRLGCELVQQAVRSIGCHLSGYISEVVPLMVAHLERSTPLAQKTHVLQAFICLSDHAYPTDNSILLSRATRALLPHLARIVAPRSTPVQETGTGKKRKAYEGEELFAVGSEVLLPTAEDGKALVLVLDCVARVLRCPALPAHLQSLAGRLIVTLALELPGMSAGTLSVDESLHGRLLEKVTAIAAELACGRATMGRAVGVVVRTVGEFVGTGSGVERQLDLLLRPRLAPIPRSRATLDSDVLAAADKVQEQAVAASIGLVVSGQPQPQSHVNGNDAMAVDSPAVEPRLPANVAPATNAPAQRPNATTVFPAPDFAAPKATVPVQASPVAPAWGAASDVVKGAVAPVKPAPATATPTTARLATSDSDGEGEEMPAIDMRSDSEEE